MKPNLPDKILGVPWKEYLEIKPVFDLSSRFGSQHLLRLFQDKLIPLIGGVDICSLEGHSESEGLPKIFEEQGFCPLFTNYTIGDKEDHSQVWVSPYGVAFLISEPPSYTHIYVLGSTSQVEPLRRALKKAADNDISPTINLFCRQDGEPVLREVKFDATKLTEENYSKDVLSSTEHFLTQTQTKEPTGRLLLLHGPPGTGKSRLVEGIIHRLTKEQQQGETQVVIVPSSLIPDLSGPDFLPQLLRERMKITTLILEDADEALVQREQSVTHLAPLAELLNLTDGILGRLLNLFVIATTNAASLNIDKALLRPGRLCATINVKPLSWERAKKVVARLEKPPLDKEREYTLAELYAWPQLSTPASRRVEVKGFIP